MTSLLITNTKFNYNCDYEYNLLSHAGIQQCISNIKFIFGNPIHISISHKEPRSIKFLVKSWYEDPSKVHLPYTRFNRTWNTCTIFPFKVTLNEFQIWLSENFLLAAAAVYRINWYGITKTSPSFIDIMNRLGHKFFQLI